MHPRSSRPTLARRSHAKSRPAPSANPPAAQTVPAGEECITQVILPRRKAGQPETERESEPVVLNRDVLESLFHLPLAAASGKLGLSATSIKKVCRRMGIIKWPYKSCRSGSKRGSGATSPTSSENSAAATPPHHESASSLEDEDEDETVEEGEEGASAAPEPEEEAPVEAAAATVPQHAASHRQEAPLGAAWGGDRTTSAELLALDACYEEDLRTTQILDEYVMSGGRAAWDGAACWGTEALRADDFLSYTHMSSFDLSC